MPKKYTTHLYAQSLAPYHKLGPVLNGDQCRFTLWCRDADTLDLYLFEHPTDLRPIREIHLNPEEHRFGDLWSVEVPGVKAGWSYVWRLDRPENTFPKDQYILDPYAPAVAGPAQWGQSLIRQPGDPLHTGKAFPKGVIVASDFDWGHDRPPNIPWDKMIVYETHVRGFTAGPGSGVEVPGTYAGFIEKVPYLKTLGITSVELLPVYEFDEMEYYHQNDNRSGLRNYWGYSTQSFFAPMSRFAKAGNQGQQVDEFKSLVKAIHAQGMEVILDVVYNHTMEGGTNGPNVSFKILGQEVYYQIDTQTQEHKNYSGCGNTVNCNHPVVMQLILDSLRHWVMEYHIDGFRFDLASILCRGRDGEMMARPPLIEAIDEDPILRGVKMIAEAWDAAGAYQVGNFPSPRWAEWNGKYRDEIRRFWSGEPGRLSSFATRVLGSEDLYSGEPMGAAKSVNFICCHDGFTLRDLVSYRDKHNDANLEQNRDGEKNNHSNNCGYEGETADPEIRQLRLQMQKNFLATLLISRGIPMIPAGDERGRTQKGNNNAYCQDNELSWLDWTLDADRKELLSFFKKLIRLRECMPALHFSGLVHDQGRETAHARVRWIGPSNRDPDWGRDQAVGLRLSGKAEHLGIKEDSEDILIFFNASAKPAKFHIPDTDKFKWKMRAYTTHNRVHRSNLGTVMTAKPQSMVVFSAKAKVLS
ncbi:glycogen debranching protein GlgX [Kiritimatiellaeota bacterium B1221]|nr:glycogen debranching protein GlgX [Kiritimatiellaeota bacterium B1221]